MTVAALLTDPDVQATFVEAPDGGAPRNGWLALWRRGEAIEGADTSVELALPAGTQIRKRLVSVRRVDIDRVLDPLIDLRADTESSSSVRAWSVAARLTVELIARGRLLPSMAADGTDAWRVGPLDPADVARRAALIAALPPEAHALVITGRRPTAVGTPARAATSFADAIADAFPRTTAAPVAAGHLAFAAREPADVAADGGWLENAAAGATEEASVALRLVPPDEDDDAFVGVLQLQSTVDPSLVVDAADLWDAPAAVAARFGADADTALLLTLRRGARVWPPLGRVLDEPRPETIELDDREADDLLGPTIDDLAAAGLSVLWPAEMFRPVDVRPVARPAPGADSASGLSLSSLLEVRFEASLDGEKLTEGELAALAEAKRPVVRLRGRWVRADPQLLERLRTRRKVRGGEALGLALGAALDVDGDALEVEIEGPLADLAERLRGFASDRSRSAPKNLDATLRAYQERGLAWLVEMANLGLGGVLADDMGLGKTVQLLAAHLTLLDERETPGPTLVVCPVSLVANWEREAARFAPDIAVRRYHGSTRRLDDLAPGELVLATYGVVRRDHEALASVDWMLVVADEAQAVKNPMSRTARALRTLPATARFALTGTPVENRLVDLWALLDWTTPGLLGPLDRFRHEVAVPVERERDPEATESLARLVRPFLLRRRKSDPTILPDLPPKTETDRLVPLTAEQATLYRAVVAETMALIEEADGMSRRGLVLKLLTALKQICNHPAHYLGQDGPLPGRSGKLDATVDLLDVISSEGDATLLFTQYVGMGHLLDTHLTGLGLRTHFLHGSLGMKKRQALVDSFQSGGADVFILSLKAGGTGLNLTRATHVVHYDRWWNPAVEDQASDRAWRIGQDRPVQVHRMVCEGTVEDRVAALLTSKRELADAVVGTGEGWVSELSDADLAELVALSADGGGLGSETGDGL